MDLVTRPTVIAVEDQHDLVEVFRNLKNSVGLNYGEAMEYVLFDKGYSPLAIEHIKKLDKVLPDEIYNPTPQSS
jgi:hypothetical protein